MLERPLASPGDAPTTLNYAKRIYGLARMVMALALVQVLLFIALAAIYISTHSTYVLYWLLGLSVRNYPGRSRSESPSQARS